MKSFGKGCIPLAHSPDQEGKPGDPYERHVDAVRKGARKRAQEMLSFVSVPPPGFLEAVEAAATFHDLGKLDPENQAALCKGRGKRLKWDHIDAGVAHLSSKKNWMASWLVRGHHAPGLPRKIHHFDLDRLGRRLRGRRNDDDLQERHIQQIEQTNRLIERYLNVHKAVAGEMPVEPHRPQHGLTMRLALSCLVDADHEDSAFFDNGRRPPKGPKPRWAERLTSLREHVQGLPAGDTEAEELRNERRSQFFFACLQSGIEAPLVTCEGPVGLGKTTAVAAYLIKKAEQNKLRHLIIVAPYTNILTQTAERLRKALVLPDENPFEVVVEHHHRAEFSHIDERELSVLWRAPVVLTTSVSFFETLAACHPSALRKLHAVPGSAIFLDEAHAALPTRLWPQNWRWLQELAKCWGCRFVLASGSLVRFWEQGEMVKEPGRLPELLPTEQLTGVMKDERSRIKFVQTEGGRVVEVDELIDLAEKQPGPRLLILNTVQNAAVVASTMRKRDLDVLHLSTALTPNDRESVLRIVEKRLERGKTGDWSLVATSCVESGVDLSFRCAFRERFGTSSTIQVGGRVNRHGEYSKFGPGEVRDFCLTGRGITQHPGASVSAGILHEFMGRDLLNIRRPADVVTLAMMDELKSAGGLQSDPLLKAELERDYPRVKELGKVIDADTRFVVVDRHLSELLRKRNPVDFRTLLQGSVQMWVRKIDLLRLELLPGRRDIYDWTYEYDPDFLGYMKGVLKLEEFIASGGAVI